jgi:hypothetical protein
MIRLATPQSGVSQMPQKPKRPAASADRPAPEAQSDHDPIAAVPNPFEYSISNIVLTQGGPPLGGNANPNQNLVVSGIASPASNAGSVEVSIYHYDNGTLTLYAALITYTRDPLTGAWTATISSATLQQLSGHDLILEITANGPDPATTPVTHRPVHID